MLLVAAVQCCQGLPLSEVASYVHCKRTDLYTCANPKVKNSIITHLFENNRDSQARDLYAVGPRVMCRKAISTVWGISDKTASNWLQAAVSGPGGSAVREERAVAKASAQCSAFISQYLSDEIDLCPTDAAPQIIKPNKHTIFDEYAVSQNSFASTALAEVLLFSFRMSAFVRHSCSDIETTFTKVGSDAVWTPATRQTARSILSQLSAEPLSAGCSLRSRKAVVCRSGQKTVSSKCDQWFVIKSRRGDAAVSKLFGPVRDRWLLAYRMHRTTHRGERAAYDVREMAATQTPHVLSISMDAAGSTGQSLIQMWFTLLLHSARCNLDSNAGESFSCVCWTPLQEDMGTESPATASMSLDPSLIRN